MGVLEPLLTAWLAVLGGVVGSFLNVVIYRLPRGESVVRPRSRCPHCGELVRWYDNIPVLSWLLLRGKCRHCRAPISFRYPAIELLTALLFLACKVQLGWTYELAMALVLVTLLVPISFIDAEHWILPFELTLPGIAAGILMSIPLGTERLWGAVLGAAGGFLLFRSMEYVGWKLFGKEALGAGDKFLLALLGAFLTHRALLGLLFLSSFQGSVIGIGKLLMTGRAGPEGEGEEGAAEGTDDAEAEATFRWSFLEPGLSFGRRLLRVPYALLFQPIPDDPVDDEGEPVEWQPGATNLPFGPWIALAGLELLLIGPWLAANIPLYGMGRLLFGVSAP